ncbi:hypothetical protein [Arthrobacter castelli]|uniref:hypothetical protein n=1 Tax=Arthrobacter castelli TaxID=271431 RepID=UPI000560677E|nr:hypothetical protein [Arthrobacter castelli]
MIELPRKYTEFMDTLDPAEREAFFPVFEQSAAQGDFGVLIRGVPSEHQALVSESVPFGEVHVEGA